MYYLSEFYTARSVKITTMSHFALIRFQQPRKHLVDVQCEPIDQAKREKKSQEFENIESKSPQTQNCQLPSTSLQQVQRQY